MILTINLESEFVNNIFEVGEEIIFTLTSDTNTDYTHEYDGYVYTEKNLGIFIDNQIYREISLLANEPYELNIQFSANDVGHHTIQLKNLFYGENDVLYESNIIEFYIITGKNCLYAT